MVSYVAKSKSLTQIILPKDELTIANTMNFNPGNGFVPIKF